MLSQCTARLKSNPPKMSRRHFEYIAQCIREMAITEDERRYIAGSLAVSLGKCNSNFKAGKFVSLALLPWGDVDK